MPHRVLLEDWSEYDNRKAQSGKDAAVFAFDEGWEVDYLLNKVRKYNPLRSETEIKAAIAKCFRSTAGTKKREPFVECVMSWL